MIAQRASTDDQSQLNDYVPREQYDEMRRIANALLFWTQKVQNEGAGSLNSFAFETDLIEAARLGLTGNR